jgi:5-methylcytosine-specific restriction endonuclease McrA
MILCLPGFKRCAVCGSVLSLDAFYNNASRRDGKAKHCKGCAERFTKEWKARNQEHVKAHRRERYVRERTWEFLKRKEWYERKVQEEGEAFLAHEREINRESCRKYREEHVEQRKASAAKRKAAKLGCLEHFTAEEWEMLCARFEKRCLKCGRQDKSLTPDHVVPLAWGGSDTIENIQPLCGQCNSSKGARRATDYRESHNAARV